MRKIIFILFFSIYYCVNINAQDGGYSYLKETKWGFNKNTAGGLIGGIIVKHSIAIDNRMFHTFGIELMNINHPNEQRIRNRSTNSFYKFAKQNYLYSIRLQYGRDLVLFQKAPQQGAQVIAMLAGGPSIGILNPYFINVKNRNVPYNPSDNLHRSLNGSVLGPGRLFQGLGHKDARIIPGINIKAGVSFEFGVFKNNVTGFELGFLVDAYSQKMIIVDGSEKMNVFATSFITIFWGSRK